MFETFSRSFSLVKESFQVLRQDKEILLFPILSAVVTMALFFSFIIPLFVTKFFATSSLFYFILFFIYYLLSYFIVIFFNVGLITCANMRLNGKDPTFKDGIKNAVQHLDKILFWALISATVGIILRTIAERSKGNIGKIIASILGMAWSLLTFFVVPIMVLENKSVFESIKKSTVLFKKTWGENVITQFSMSAVFSLLAFLGFIPLILSFFLGSFISILVALAFVVPYLVILAVIGSSLNGIFVAALYQYANTGKVPIAFTEEHVKMAFRQK